MADDERHAPGEGEPSLELPSLRSAFRRRKRRASRDPTPAESARDDSMTAPAAAEQDTSIQPVATIQEPTEEPTEAPPDPKRRREWKPVRLHLPGPVVALITGAIVGLALVGLTAASLHLCSSVRGTSSCGKPGILVLLVITVAMVLLGSLLLRVAGVTSHGSTSFLGVGLLVVLILLALLPVLDEWWVVIVVPAVAMVTYAASWWLTTTYADTGNPPTSR